MLPSFLRAQMAVAMILTHMHTRRPSFLQAQRRYLIFTCAHTLSDCRNPMTCDQVQKLWDAMWAETYSAECSAKGGWEAGRMQPKVPAPRVDGMWALADKGSTSWVGGKRTSSVHREQRIAGGVFEINCCSSWGCR